MLALHSFRLARILVGILAIPRLSTFFRENFEAPFNRSTRIAISARLTHQYFGDAALRGERKITRLLAILASTAFPIPALAPPRRQHQGGRVVPLAAGSPAT
jgi:hypothetical protein